MMALAGVELETLVSEPDALTTRPPLPPYLLFRRLRFGNCSRSCFLYLCNSFYLWYICKVFEFFYVYLTTFVDTSAIFNNHNIQSRGDGGVLKGSTLQAPVIGAHAPLIAQPQLNFSAQLFSLNFK